MRKLERGQQGLALSVEAAIVLPSVVLFILLLITLARLVLTEHAVGAAATSAARTATLAGADTAAARQVANTALVQRDVACKNTSIAVATRAKAVVVTIGCRVDLSDISLPMIPGSIEVSATRSSALDPARSE